MAYDRFLIAPMKSGLITDVKAWQIPEDAFERLNNAYIHKGIVRKRFGSTLLGPTSADSLSDQLLSRLRIKLGTTDINGDLTGTVPGAVFEVGQMFSIDTAIYTVAVVGTPATLLETYATTTATFNTTTGVYTFVGSIPSKDVYFYPAQPVMGITNYEQNNHITPSNVAFAFDTQFIYKYSGGAWDRSGTVVLQGDNKDFVWAANWTGRTLDEVAMFISNFNTTIGTPDASDDPMYVYRNSTWAEFRPVFRVLANVADGFVTTARIIIPFKNRLLLLGTVERNVTTSKNEDFPNRCRFSHNGVPFPADVPNNVASAVSAAWLEGSQTWTIGATTKKSDGAGFLDAPTSEEIIAAEFIKDRLIVYFERSTWELAYTGNQVLPFTWQKINTELGSRSQYSPVPFDKAIFAVGKNAIHGCSGANVSAISDKIGDQVFEIRNSNSGHHRVHGIRDYFTEVVYWSFPSINAHISSQVFPDKILIYNYMNDSWATADDTITAFGYLEGQNGITWESNEYNWLSANFNWDSGSTQSSFRQIVAGNQQGFTFICASGISINEPVMQVTDISYSGDALQALIINHTLNDGDYLRFIDLEGVSLTGDGIYIVSVVDPNTVVLHDTVMTGTYEGGGRAARVSQIDITSKQWNFYIDKGKSFFLAKIDFAVQKTSNGEITVDYYPSSTKLSMIESAQATGSLLGDNNLQTHPFDLYPLEQEQNRLWHPVYFQTEGECVQIRIYLDHEQMIDPAISASDFQLEGLVVFGMQTSERLQ